MANGYGAPNVTAATIGRVSFFRRDFPGAMAPAESGPAEVSQAGAWCSTFSSGMAQSFTSDLARRSGLEPSRVRAALDELAGLGLATNDRFEPLRTGSRATLLALDRAATSQRDGRSFRRAPGGRFIRHRKGAGRASSVPPTRAKQGSWLGQTRYWAATACLPARYSLWSHRPHGGATSCRCSHGPSGEGRFAAVSSSKGFRGFSTPPLEAAAELMRLSAASEQLRRRRVGIDGRSGKSVWVGRAV